MLLSPGVDIAPTITGALELPRIVHLGPNLYGAAFSLMKLLPARHILDRARDHGLLDPGTVVIESTSGTFGLALAMECRLRGRPLVLVSDPAVDPRLRRRMRDLGAAVDIVAEPAAVGGYQQARLDRLAELRSRHPRHFLPAQYSNPDNPGAYGALAEFLTAALGRVDFLVGPVGSGGSMCGTAAALRAGLQPALAAVAVDTPGSVLFGQRDAPRQIRGLGNSLMPPNLHHAAFDEIHWVSDREGFAATRALHRRHALYMGPTSGAAWMVAEWKARLEPDARVVVLLPDEGHRYQDTVYDDAWLRRQGLRLRRLPSRPTEVDAPDDGGPEWSWLRWNRRRLEAVVPSGHPRGAAA
ncbi:MAG TPA: cysteine synthase family protein [Acidimicrobiia bacterium]|jgi:cysteine synthase A|nr:cysteine synthase family protein [Acidimicrobiia bacterium]